MAAGYTKVTNRPQVVMLHATAGPLNAAMTLRAALHERTPMVIISGEIAAYGENTKVADPGGQWLHDLTDLGGSPDLLRGCVKWADRISSAELFGPTIERAVRIAVEPPAGPVLIGIPFECMMEQVNDIDHGKANEVVRAHAVDDASIDKALSLIAAAKNPIALTEHVGGDPRAVERFVELCELFAIPVMETYRPAFMNFPRNPSALSASRSQSRRRGGFDFDGRRRHALVSGEQDAEERQSHCHRRRVSQLAPALLGLQRRSRPGRAAGIDARTTGEESQSIGASRRQSRELRSSALARTREQHDSYFGKLKDEAQKHADDDADRSALGGACARASAAGKFSDLRRDDGLPRLDPRNDSAQPRRNPISRASPADSASV